MREAEKMSGILSAAFGDIHKEVFSELLVAYYNDEEVGRKLDNSVTQRMLHDYGIQCMLFKDSERMAFLLLQMTERFRLTDDDASDEELRRIQKNAQELRTSRQRFQAAVKWLVSSPKETKPAAATKELRRLYASGKIEVGRFPLIDKKSEGFVKYFEDHGLKHLRIRATLQDCLYLLPRYHHLVDLFCAFLLNECAGKALSEMPFKVCGQCERLFSPQRLEAEYCSDKCRREKFWTPERHRDYTYVSRLEEFTKKCASGKFGYSVNDLRDKLQQSAARLAEIENRWHNWRKITEKIQGIRDCRAA